MSAARPDIPIVVLPSDNVVRARTRPAPSVVAALSTSIDALTRLRTELLNPAGAAGSAKEALDEAVDSLDRLALEARVVPMDTASLVPIVPNHEYFGVRTASIDDAYLVSEVSTILARTLADLRGAHLDLNDQAAEVLAMTQILTGLLPEGEADVAPGRAVAEGLPEPYVLDTDELSRWVITHHFYFVLNLAAAEAVSRVVAAVREGERDAAFDALQEAIGYVRGFTAAMLHSGDMSAPCYNATVRPTMQPPAVPVALTGRTQPEHKAFRKAMRSLVKHFDEPFAKLFANDPELALARDALLEADLQDIERHIAITATLVGDDRSIVQGGEAPTSAIAMLRTMRHARAQSYKDLMRFGDPVTLTEV
ncbi:hypothetical protein ACFVOK_14000 [Streptomyces sp. NPDC057798]|uniref:hypothetical protein n=1 Tax=Streptomyces sp. NPDC057798 TaxID=3346252 RepID=UPI00367D7B78